MMFTEVQAEILREFGAAPLKSEGANTEAYLSAGGPRGEYLGQPYNVGRLPRFDWYVGQRAARYWAYVHSGATEAPRELQSDMIGLGLETWRAAKANAIRVIRKTVRAEDLRALAYPEAPYTWPDPYPI